MEGFKQNRNLVMSVKKEIDFVGGERLHFDEQKCMCALFFKMNYRWSKLIHFEEMCSKMC